MEIIFYTLRQVRCCVLSEQLFCLGIVCHSSGLFITKKANWERLPITGYPRLPIASVFAPYNTLIFRGAIALLLAHIPGVLLNRADTQIALSIVQAVVIYMVDKFAFRRFQYCLVHSDCFGFGSVSVRTSRTRCVESPFASNREPFISGEFFVSLRVDDCVFTLRKGNFAECTAVPQAAITQQ